VIVPGSRNASSWNTVTGPLVSRTSTAATVTRASSPPAGRTSIPTIRARVSAGLITTAVSTHRMAVILRGERRQPRMSVAISGATTIAAKIIACRTIISSEGSTGTSGLPSNQEKTEQADVLIATEASGW
jgi:hypothetical protein